MARKRFKSAKISNKRQQAANRAPTSHARGPWFDPRCAHFTPLPGVPMDAGMHSSEPSILCTLRRLLAGARRAQTVDDCEP
jgi:hypothetical protein